MSIQMRKGYQNYEVQLEKAFGFLAYYGGQEIERRTDGSFYSLTIKPINTRVESIRIYHEFIEQQLLVILQIDGEFTTTLELNKRLQLFKEEDLKAAGDDYEKALQKNAEVVKKVITDRL